jgi:hypothetical protein
MRGIGWVSWLLAISVGFPAGGCANKPIHNSYSADPLLLNKTPVLGKAPGTPLARTAPREPQAPEMLLATLDRRPSPDIQQAGLQPGNKVPALWRPGESEGALKPASGLQFEEGDP